MRCLPIPTADPGEVFRACISTVQSTDLKQRLSTIEPLVVSAAEEYVLTARKAELHTLDTASRVGAVSSSEMIWLYEQKMVPKGSPGRKTYDSIRLSSVSCPLCGHRDVQTVDHYLPKAWYPALTVIPANLVPACSDCNRTKNDVVSHIPEDQILHPYFDNIDGDVWLRAEVSEETPPSIQFSVSSPSSWSTIQRQRVEHHFKLFKLAILYASNASTELSNIQFAMAYLLDAGGPAAVKADLTLRAVSCAASQPNSWQTALYRALSENQWYCSGGFLV